MNNNVTTSWAFIQPMMTSSYGNVFRVTGPLAGSSPVPVNSPHKGQWRGANNREAGDLRRHRGHYDVNAMV